MIPVKICCSSSSESSTTSEDDETAECPNMKKERGMKATSKVSSDPTLYDISPRLIRQMKKPCDGYQAAMCCRLGSNEPPTLARLHEIMEKIVGPMAYGQFVAHHGKDKPVSDTLLVRRVMEMLDMKNKILMQQSELPKAFNKITVSHAASKYQGALEAAEAEMEGVNDEEEAEEAAVIGVQKFKSGSGKKEPFPQPKITVLGYIGCYDDTKKKEKSSLPKEKEPCPND